MKWLGKEKNKLTIKGNYKLKETDLTDRIYSVQSSLKSHPLWVSL